MGERRILFLKAEATLRFAVIGNKTSRIILKSRIHWDIFLEDHERQQTSDGRKEQKRYFSLLKFAVVQRFHSYCWKFVHLYYKRLLLKRLNINEKKKKNKYMLRSK